MTVRSATALVALVFAFSFVPPVRAAPRVYTLDPAHSRLTIQVGKAGLFGFAGHEHEVVAGTFRGTATFDPQQSARSSIDLTFDAGALRVTGKGEPPEDPPQVQATMVGPTCLDAGRFATIHFASKSVAAAGAVGPHGGDLTVAGELTLHGVTRPLAIRVHLGVTGPALEATGATTLKQTDFGITPISKAGVVKVKDEVTLSWRISGRAP